MSLHFACEAPGVWHAHDETGDYQVKNTRSGAHVHIEVDGPSGPRTVDYHPRDANAGFDLCAEWWASVHHAQLAAQPPPRQDAA